MRHRHYLILLGFLNDAQRKAVSDVIDGNSCSWFNYTPDAWLVCTTNDGNNLRQKLSAVLGMTAYHMVMAVDNATILGGAMPEAAWKWLRQHHLMPDV